MGTAKDSSTAQNPQDAFHILSLDGGGIKGILSAAILAKFEEDLNTRVIDHFDLIAGTSTGGIIAIGLGLGLRPRELLQFYIEEGPKIFGSRLQLSHWLSAKHGAKALESALQRCFGDRKLGDSTKRLLIPAYNLSTDDVYIFRTAHLQRLKRDYKVPAWQVARATSAAPTYIPCARDIDRLRLIDGGVWANNPSMVALVEVAGKHNLGIPLEQIRMLSIGTSNAVHDRKDRLNNGGLIAWGRDGDAVEVIMRGQSLGANNQATFLLGDGHFTRLDPNVPPGKFTLDGIGSADDLIALAAHHSRSFMPKFETLFLSHKAAPFAPLYSPQREA